jgi:hypothetical protein
MKILSIGNSFSQDAQRYLFNLAKHEGVSLTTENLYIGGCSLERHHKNMLENSPSYTLELNGQSTGVLVTMKQVLESVAWDVITLQQASYASAKLETYFPYIEELASYVRSIRPEAKIFIHETWAYEDDSEKIRATERYNTAKEMLTDIQKCYKTVAETINADGIIPSGTAMYKAIELGIGKIHRDTLHASFGAGRYLLALTWYKTLTNNDVTFNNFNGFDEPVTDREREIIIKAVNEVVK